MSERRIDRRTMSVAVLAVATIGLATLVAAALEHATEIPDASAVYLVAVVIVGSVGGTWPALATAGASFVLYDVLFTEPRFSLVVADPSELLNLILVLIVALAIGRLAALGRERAAEADRRAREALGSFAISRRLATADDTEAVLGEVTELLAQDADLRRVWIGLEGGARDRILGDTGSGPVPNVAVVRSLVRMPADEPARWVRAHDPGPRRPDQPRPQRDGEVLRVRIDAGGTVFGSIWAIQANGRDAPERESTRLLSLAADQIAMGLRRDRLRQEAYSAEVARRSDALKSALLDAVSHDLRTPLASIRATAGNLADPAVEWTPDAVRQAAESIDLESQRLDRLVRSVLDLSRIESGALDPGFELFDIGELIEDTVARLRPVLGDRPLKIELADDLPLVRVDAVLFDGMIANVLDNVAQHTPAMAPVVVRAIRDTPGRVRVTIEDGGPGVPDTDLPRVFDKFHRVSRPGETARHGMGVGLSIVRGTAEALGGTAMARAGALGGLAIDIDLPTAPEPLPEATGR